MNVKVDCRERELIQKIKYYIEQIPKFANVNVVSENLPIGDVIIYDDKEEKLIIERKSVNDLMSSIKDGRYEEQSYRLSGIQHPNHNIIYLIEGNVNNVMRFKVRTDKVRTDSENYYKDKLTLYSAIFSLNYNKGFSVLRTFNIDETAIFICNTANKLIKNEKENKKPYYSSELKESKEDTIKKDEVNDLNDTPDESEVIKTIEKETTEKNYTNVVKRVKKENVTPDNIDEIMLCQIPGISAVTAKAIIEKFKTLKQLITSIENDSNSLNNVTYFSGKDKDKPQSRKINKTSIENIKKYLLKL
jgi:ERCC4-type nuclease